MNNTIGQEIIRVDFSRDGEVKDLKMKFAELYDMCTTHAMNAQAAIDSSPTILAPDAIKNHMEVIRKGEELLRCMSEACKLLELSAMWAVKGITA